MRAVSYSLTAASEVTDGGWEMMSLRSFSALRGSSLRSFRACCTLSESPCAIVYGFGAFCGFRGFSYLTA